MMQTSSALAFTTLMALVPLVAVVLAVAGAVPFLDLLVNRLDLLIREALLPSGAAGAIAGNIGKFSHKAQQLTWAGIALLSVTAFLLMNTIERAFNHLWLVKPRPILARFRLYVFVMMVWPFVLGAVAGVMSFAVTTSLGWFDEPLWFRRLALKVLAMLLLGLFFSFLYYAVPNAEVSKRAAVTGGVFAALAFSLMQKVFEMFLVSSALISECLTSTFCTGLSAGRLLLSCSTNHFSYSSPMVSCAAPQAVNNAKASTAASKSATKRLVFFMIHLR
jgi:membrane protein